MITKLIEFNNKESDILRGILVKPKKVYNNYIVLMFGGFERSGTTQKKFKKLSDELGERNIASFRFDATDCGLSDGNFYNITIESLTDDLLSAFSYLKKLSYQKVSIVGHSLASCSISLIIKKINIEKVVLIAPALNQKDLLRYWFVQKNNQNIQINWNNYKDYLKEKEFIKNCKLDLITKSHKLNYQYRDKNKEIDYSLNFSDFDKKKLLLIHGAMDDKVPLKSLNINFLNRIIIKKGDHDLEQPGIIEQWLNKAVNFLKIF